MARLAMLSRSWVMYGRAVFFAFTMGCFAMRTTVHFYLVKIKYALQRFF
jgi:hypothetical protein